MLKWDDFRKLMFWLRKKDPVLQFIPPSDYNSELWLVFDRTSKIPYNPEKRASQMGYMTKVAKRILREIALNNYQAIKQTVYFYKKDGDIKKKTQSYEDF